MLSLKFFLFLYFIFWLDYFVLCHERDCSHTSEISSEEFSMLKQKVLEHDKLIAILKNQDEIKSMQINNQAKLIMELSNNIKKQNQKISTLESLLTMRNTPPKEANSVSQEKFNSTSDIMNSTDAVSAISGKANVPKRKSQQPFQKEKRILNVPVAANNDVAFYAYMTTGEKNPSPHLTLIYDHVITDVGNAYSRHTGAFTAPSSGTYVMSWTTYTDGNSNYMSIELVVNSQAVGATFPDGGGDYAGTSGLAVLSLQQGDVVFTRTNPRYTPHGSIRSDYIMRTTFSGFRMSNST